MQIAWFVSFSNFPSAADGHILLNAPDLFWPPKLSRREPAQYWPRGLVGKCLGYCRLLMHGGTQTIRFWGLQHVHWCEGSCCWFLRRSQGFARSTGDVRQPGRLVSGGYPGRRLVCSRASSIYVCSQSWIEDWRFSEKLLQSNPGLKMWSQTWIEEVFLRIFNLQPRPGLKKFFWESSIFNPIHFAINCNQLQILGTSKATKNDKTNDARKI